ncbi:hypothetical protein FSARC_5734 [Fusarium sarcochroum]|uniref:Cutinase n=1 Tax=Fusarium sarcochroum TaxID=1208366 RepID=A0A8H4TZ14_9HYPO|nr:hypothetical protein FSARC_5734 [Fusarium sarcochroum]
MVGSLADRIMQRIPGSAIEVMRYPAARFSEEGGAKSNEQDVDELERILTKYHKDCPNSKVALLGWDQGCRDR